MAGTREYPPAPMVHHPQCAEVPPQLRGQIQQTPVIAFEHPNAWQHHCYHFTINATGIVVPHLYPQHGHRPSTRWPQDAPVPLCELCASTHPGEQRSAVRAAAASALIARPRHEQGVGGIVLPPGVRDDR